MSDIHHSRGKPFSIAYIELADNLVLGISLQHLEIFLVVNQLASSILFILELIMLMHVLCNVKEISLIIIIVKSRFKWTLTVDKARCIQPDIHTTRYQPNMRTAVHDMLYNPYSLRNQTETVVCSVYKYCIYYTW